MKKGMETTNKEGAGNRVHCCHIQARGNWSDGPHLSTSAPELCYP